jgi:hypothetical protein
MKMLILAVLLSFSHLLISSPLTIENEPSTTNHNAEPEYQKSQTQIAMAMARDRYQKQPEAVEKQATAPNTDPNYILWGFWVNAVLVLATLVIAVFAIVQASAAKRGANAALLSAKAIIGAERPWILISWSWQDAGLDVYRFMATNRGRTPAKIISVLFDSAQGLPEVPNYGNKPVAHPFLLMPDKEHKITEESAPNNRGAVYFWGRIIYSDALPSKQGNSPNIHETKWCFLREPFIAHLGLGGPDGYNDCS